MSGDKTYAPRDAVRLLGVDWIVSQVIGGSLPDPVIVLTGLGGAQLTMRASAVAKNETERPS